MSVAQLMGTCAAVTAFPRKEGNEKLVAFISLEAAQAAPAHRPSKRAGTLLKHVPGRSTL